MIVRVAVLDTPLRTALIVAVCFFETFVVLMVNSADFWPAVTDTCDGTTACVEELDNATTTPPCGAEPFRCTRPVTGLPPITEVALRVRFESAAGFTVSEACCCPP